MRIHHFFSGGNHIGDWLYAWTQRKLLEEFVPGAEIQQISFIRGEGITAKSLDCDLAVIGGGPIYYFLDPDVSGVFLADIEAVRNCKCPIIVWGTGLEVREGFDLEDARNDIKMPLFEAVHEKAVAIGVRDYRTQAFLKRYGVDSTVTGCPSHFAKRYVDGKLGTGGPTFAYRRDFQADYNKGSQIKEWWRLLLREGLSPRIMCLDPNDVDDFVVGLQGETFLPGLNVECYLSLFTSPVIAFRMHAAIPAATFGAGVLLFWDGLRGKAWSELHGRDLWDQSIQSFEAGGCFEKTMSLVRGDFPSFDCENLFRVTETWLRNALVG